MTDLNTEPFFTQTTASAPSASTPPALSWETNSVALEPVADRCTAWATAFVHEGDATQSRIALLRVLSVEEQHALCETDQLTSESFVPTHVRNAVEEQGGPLYLTEPVMVPLSALRGVTCPDPVREPAAALNYLRLAMDLSPEMDIERLALILNDLSEERRSRETAGDRARDIASGAAILACGVSTFLAGIHSIYIDGVDRGMYAWSSVLERLSDHDPLKVFTHTEDHSASGSCDSTHLIEASGIGLCLKINMTGYRDDGADAGCTISFAFDDVSRARLFENAIHQTVDSIGQSVVDALHQLSGLFRQLSPAQRVTAIERVARYFDAAPVGFPSDPATGR